MAVPASGTRIAPRLPRRRCCHPRCFRPGSMASPSQRLSPRSPRRSAPRCWNADGRSCMVCSACTARQPTRTPRSYPTSSIFQSREATRPNPPRRPSGARHQKAASQCCRRCSATGRTVPQPTTSASANHKVAHRKPRSRILPGPVAAMSPAAIRNAPAMRCSIPLPLPRPLAISWPAIAPLTSLVKKPGRRLAINSLSRDSDRPDRARRRRGARGA